MLENLLTQQQKEVIKKGYKERLLVVSLLMASAAIWFSIFILVPVYVAALAKKKEIASRNEINKSIPSSWNEILSIPSKINEKSKTVLSYKKAKYVSDILKLFFASDSRVIMNDISFSKTNIKDGGKSKIMISGIAEDREALISFQEEIRYMDFVEEVSLPVNNFVKIQNLPFSMTIIISSEGI